MYRPINNRSRIDGRPIICKKTSVTGRQNVQHLLSWKFLFSCYSTCVLKRTYQVASTLNLCVGCRSSRAEQGEQCCDRTPVTTCVDNMCVIAEDRQSQRHSARSLAQPATATQDLDIFALLSSIEPADHKPVKPLPALRYLLRASAARGLPSAQPF